MQLVSIFASKSFGDVKCTWSDASFDMDSSGGGGEVYKKDRGVRKGISAREDEENIPGK